MRVCQLTVAHRPIDERILQKMSVSLVAAGHEVVFFAPFAGEAYEVRGVQVRPLIPGRSKAERVLKTIPAAIRAVAREAFDVVHVHDPELFPLVPLFRLMGKKVVMDVHEDYGWNAAERVGAPFARSAARWAVWLGQWTCGLVSNAVITVDFVTAALFPRLGPCVIGNYPPRGIAESERNPDDHGRRPFEVVYVGNMSPERGLSVLVDAVDGIQDIPVRLNLIGQTEGRDLLSGVQHPERFRMHGRLPWKETLEVIRGFHAGVLLFQPTAVLTHVSGRGNTKLFEYFGAGLPAIISDFPLLRKLAVETGGAVCVDPTKPESVAEAIRSLANDKELWQRVSAAGRASVRESFNWESDEKKLLRLYCTLAGGGRG